MAAAADWDAPPEAQAQDDDFSPFAANGDAGPRRSRGPLLLLVAALVVAALAAAFWFLAPDQWKARRRAGSGRSEPPGPGHDPYGPAATGKRQRAADGLRAGDQPDIERARRASAPGATAVQDRQSGLQLDDRAAGADLARRARAHPSTAPRSMCRRAVTSSPSPSALRAPELFEFDQPRRLEEGASRCARTCRGQAERHRWRRPSSLRRTPETMRTIACACAVALPGRRGGSGARGQRRRQRQEAAWQHRNARREDGEESLKPSPAIGQIAASARHCAALGPLLDAPPCQ